MYKWFHRHVRARVQDPGHAGQFPGRWRIPVPWLVEGTAGNTGIGGGMSRASVLVVDDDSDFRSLVSDELIGAGYEVAVAGGAEEGLRRLAGEEVDVLVLDLQMPGKNGCELLREARSMGVQSQTVVITGYPEMQAAQECLEAGAFELLEKPVSLRMLLSTVAHAVE